MYNEMQYPGLNQKLNAIGAHEDDIPEIQRNKSLVLPILNDTSGVRAYYDLTLTDATLNLRISAISPGVAGNSLEVMATDAATPSTPPSVIWASPTLAIVLTVNENAEPTMTAYEAARLLKSDTDFNDHFLVTYSDGSDVTEDSENAQKVVVATVGGQSLANGAEPTAPLESTSEEIDAAVDQAPVSGAPVMAVAASKVLTVADVPHEGDTVTIGSDATEIRYRARLDPLSETGVKAACSLNLTADPPHDGDFVTLGLITYTFKTALTPTAGEVLIEATSADSALNLVAAVSGGAGAGTKYATGTSASPNITVAAVNDTMTVEYNTYGTLGNSFDLLTGNGVNPMTHGSFHQATLHGGVDPMANGDVYVNGSAQNFIINLEKAIEATGTNGTDYYFTTPAAHTDAAVSAKDASTMTLTALVKGSSGNSIVIGKAGDHLSWDGDAELLSGGIPGTVAIAGSLRYEATKVWIAITESTAENASTDIWKWWALT